MTKKIKQEKVWKEEYTEYYTRILKNPNRDGLVNVACSRRVSNWCANINGKICRGFGTKRAALAAIREMEKGE